MTDDGKSVKADLINKETDSIQSLYDKVMSGFSGNKVDFNSGQIDNGYYHSLYAPGYETIGVSDIVAQCK